MMQPSDVEPSGTAAPGLPANRETNAARALAEAEQRRAQRNEAQEERPTESSGRGGLDPARYGDWEVKGIASDF